MEQEQTQLEFVKYLLPPIRLLIGWPSSPARAGNHLYFLVWDWHPFEEGIQLIPSVQKKRQAIRGLIGAHPLSSGLLPYLPRVGWHSLGSWLPPNEAELSLCHIYH